ncbi:MAG: L,D-transpeptidase [Phreatobacter sp.]|jgi:lipoprotein-anchoring transpeptidase ErfK/SrfK|nr:L,D-transpeptidase [Phreatobacter sp.]
MNRRLVLAAALSLAASAASANPFAQTIMFDPDTREPLIARPHAAAARAPAIPREIVAFQGAYAPGTVVVNTAERRLYLVLADGRALRYGIGVGRPGFEWAGSPTITRKQEWPDWRPPVQMLQRRPDLPRFMAGGPDNPLGARALYLGSSLYRIHGSNEPHTIGQAVSSGCIRMLNEDVVDLYDRVRVGTRVVVLR